MADLAATAVPLGLLNPTGVPVLPAGAKAQKIRETAEAFEASFIAALLQPVFDTLDTDGPFGGGNGEAAFKSFMVEAVAKQTARAGGIGLTDTIQREMLKLQGAQI